MLSLYIKLSARIWIRLLSLLILFTFPVPLYANPDADMAFPDYFEDDDTPAEATYVNQYSIFSQRHTFHKTGDEDWFWFTALKSDVAIEIKTVNPGSDCETVITLYDTDGVTQLAESRHSLSDGTHLISWRPTGEGDYFAKITNKDESKFGRSATYELWIYKPHAPVAGRIDGVITDAASGQRLEGVSVSTPFDEVRSASDGFFYMGCPAGEISVSAEKAGYESYQTVVSMGEDQRIELNVALNSSHSYSSSYAQSQWGSRGSDTYYCVDICDLTGTPYAGLQAVECGENLHAWSAQNYINITLGIPDSALSGFQFMWKVWSPTGYGGDGFEGVITVP